MNQSAVFKCDAFAVVVVAQQRRQGLNLTKNPIQNINKMAELGK